MNDAYYMEQALKLAEKGCGWVSPNPMVGAVIVKNGKVIGEGYHERRGEFHAERNAILHASESVEGATIYVTLEPCCHYGKQPPCVDAIIEAGIKRVVIGSGDPNPLVAGKGIKILREHGIQVTEDVLRDECDSINRIFFHYIQTGTPYVIMKYAMTMDGKIATCTGASQWVTGEEARAQVHWQRHACRGIMVGVGTVITDDPMLTCRIEGGRNPVRIICDSGLRTPLTSKIVQTAGEIPTIIATCCREKEAYIPYEKAGCRIILTEALRGRVDLQDLMRKLGKEEIDSILLEGGSTLNWSALEQKIVQKVQAYIAPKIFGSQTAKTPVGGAGITLPEEAVKLKNIEILQIGKDYLIEGEVE